MATIKQVKKLIHGAREAEDRGIDSLLDRLGLQRRSSALAPLLWLAAGALVAGAAVLLATSTSGKNLRQRIVTVLDGDDRAAPIEPRADAAVKNEANGAKHHEAV